MASTPRPTTSPTTDDGPLPAGDALALFDGLPLPAWLVEPSDGTVRAANVRARELLRDPPARLEPSTDADGRATLSLPGPDGQTVELDVQRATMRIGGRSLVCVTAVDVGAHRRHEASLQDANRRKDELLAGLGHELRDALAPICNAMTLLDRATDPRMVENAKSLMSRQLGQMVRTIDELLEVSRLTAGKLRLVRERFEVQRVLHLAEESCRPTLAQRGQSLGIEPPGRPVWLDGDVLRLAQVFSRLVEEVSRHAPSGQPLTLAVDADAPHQVQVRLLATGAPIVIDAVARLLDPASATDPSGSGRLQGGVAMGLPLARRLVELHGGTVEPGDAALGVALTVTLPVSARTEGGARWNAAEAPADDAQSRRRIVVADDNVDAADSLSLMLQLAGHQVVTAYDGLAAFDAIRTHHPHIAVLDLGMPVMDGLRLARRVREQPWGRDVTLVAVTGWGQPADRQRAFDAGFDHHLTKPSDLEQLQALVAASGRRAADAVASDGPADRD